MNNTSNEKLNNLALEYSKLHDEQRKQFIIDNKISAKDLTVIQYRALKMKTKEANNESTH